jgi:secreted trypsin-like serine protease
MKRRVSILVAVLATTSLLAIPAGAITFGYPDGGLHPNVGQMIVELPNGNKVGVCTGTLIAPKVFLTASHCLAWMPGAGITFDKVWVTFDAEVDASATLHHGLAVINPQFGGPRSNPNDVAVILLDEIVVGITPASLPTAGLLDEMKQTKSLKSERFVTVGYGLLRDDKTGGPHSLADTTERHYAEQSFLSLQPYWIQLSMNPSTGSGGTCYGDSGGPHFIGQTDVIAAITVTGDAFCRATDVAYRMDTDSARSFLGHFVTLP